MLSEEHTGIEGALFKKLVELSSDLFLTVDNTGKIHYANPAVLTFFAKDSYEDQTLFTLINQPEHTHLQAFIHDVLKSGDTAYLEQSLSGKDKDCVFDGFAYKISDQHVALTLRDITQKRECLRELEDMIEEKTKELSQTMMIGKEMVEQQKVFMSMVSHEFRTPLTIIDGNAQIIQNRGDTLTKEILARRANTIRNAVDRLVGLIERILSGHALDKGKLKINPQYEDIIPVVRDVCFERLGIEPDAKIKLNIEKGLPKLMLDTKLMHQVMVNLISNAFKYSPHNPEIEVQLYQKNGFIFLEVSDNGVGIPKDELSKIFTKYFRASTSGGIPGTGLGLNLVKQIVEMHGGSVLLKSQVDVGSTFIIKLPIGEPPADYVPEDENAGSEEKEEDDA